jgi:hypothetical protein
MMRMIVTLFSKEAGSIQIDFWYSMKFTNIRVGKTGSRAFTTRKRKIKVSS